MKHKLLLALLLPSLFISSCFCDDCSVHVYITNTWFFRDRNRYYAKVNLSTYFEDDYLVLGIILKKGESFTIYKEIVDDSSKTINFDVVEFIDATGSELIFNESNYCDITTSTTIKINYEKLDEDFKYNKIEGGEEHKSTSIYVCGFPIITNYEGIETQKVAFQEDILSTVGFYGL